MENDYWQGMTVLEALQQRIFETREVWYNGDIHIYDMWQEGTHCYISGATQSGYVFYQRVAPDAIVGVLKRK